MGSLARFLLELVLRLRILSPVLRPVVRLVVSLVAIPLFRFCVHRLGKAEALSRELQKDLEQWFRGAVLLLIASANMESILFGWVPPHLREQYEWLAVGLRVLLAIGVIEGMPDQALFSIIHPGPSMLLLPKGRRIRGLCENWRALAWGVWAKHLNRSSPVFAILCVLFTGPVGWVCYWLAVAQYLIIGLVSSRDAAMDALEQFDREYEMRRAEVLYRVHHERSEAEVREMFSEPPAEGSSPVEGPLLPDVERVRSGGLDPVKQVKAE